MRRVLLIGLTVTVPLLVAYGSPLRDPINTPKVALLIAGVTVIAAIRGAELVLGASTSGLGRLATPALCFAIPLFLAWLASSDRAYSLSGADYGRYQGLIPYLLAIALGVLVADAFADRAHQIAWALGAAGSVVAAYALVQFFGADVFPNGPGWSGSGLAISTLGNENFTGGFLAICLAANAPLATGSGRSRRIAAVMCYIIAIGLGRSYSQGAWVAAIDGVAIAMGFALAHRWSWTKLAGTIVAIGMVVVSLGTVLLARAGVDLEVLATARSRGLTWETTMRAARDKPLLGHGLNMFGFVQPDYRSEEALASQTRSRQVPDDPHSVMLAMLVNGGLLTLLGFVAVLVWFMTHATRVPPGNLTGAAFIGAVTAYLIQSLVSIDEVTLRVAFWICLGGLAAFLSRGDAPEGRGVATGAGILRTGVAGGLILVAGVMSVWWAVHFLDIHRG